MKAAKNLLLAIIVTLTGMSAGAKDLLKRVSNTPQNEAKQGGNETNGMSGHGGSCD